MEGSEPPFGALLKRFRRAAGLTQEALAERAQLSARAISNLERGVNQTPRHETLELLSQALALSPHRRALLFAATRPAADPASAVPLAARSSHNLPIAPTPLLGREREVVRAAALLARPAVRLLTLTGPGGVGKTRLGLQVAEEVADHFDDGVCFVPLAALHDASLVAPTILQGVGLGITSGSPVEALRDTLRARHVLLLLDNFEHLATAAPLLADLLSSCPRVKLLVSSRAALHVRGEQELPVEPLEQATAETLFLRRAEAVHPNLALTVEALQAVSAICRQLDCLPLAIELAAARVKVLPPHALLARLDRSLSVLTGGARDLEERQQTMQATLDWSYGLLPLPEQRVFRRLAVFAGEWTLEAAEAVCMAPEGAEPCGLEMVEGLAALVDQSMIQLRAVVAEARFSMLQVVREYALERLEASAEGAEAVALRRAHAAYFMRFAGQVGWRKLAGPEPAQWHARMERDLDNLRAALAWARDHREVEMGMRLAVGLGMFWLQTGRQSEGSRWFAELLALDESQAAVHGKRGVAQSREALAARAHFLVFAGDYALDRGEWEEATTLFRGALETARKASDVTATVLAQRFLGAIALKRGETEHGKAHFEESLVLARRSGDVDLLLHVLLTSSYALAAQGEWEQVVAWAEEGHALARRSRRPMQQAQANEVLALIAVQQGELTQARALAIAALKACLGIGIKRAGTLWVLALVAGQVGQGDRAPRLLGASLAEYERAGIVLSQRERAITDAAMAPSRAALGEEAWAAALAIGEALPFEEAVAMALEEGSTGRVLQTIRPLGNHARMAHSSLSATEERARDLT
jgi:predicted ATPase/transcriptional regulator with XRE-family HTH domain